MSYSLFSPWDALCLCVFIKANLAEEMVCTYRNQSVWIDWWSTNKECLNFCCFECNFKLFFSLCSFAGKPFSFISGRLFVVKKHSIGKVSPHIHICWVEKEPELWGRITAQPPENPPNLSVCVCTRVYLRLVQGFFQYLVCYPKLDGMVLPTTQLVPMGFKEKRLGTFSRSFKKILIRLTRYLYNRRKTLIH